MKWSRIYGLTSWPRSANISKKGKSFINSLSVGSINQELIGIPFSSWYPKAWKNKEKFAWNRRYLCNGLGYLFYGQKENISNTNWYLRIDFTKNGQFHFCIHSEPIFDSFFVTSYLPSLRANDNYWKLHPCYFTDAIIWEKYLWKNFKASLILNLVATGQPTKIWSFHETSQKPWKTSQQNVLFHRKKFLLADLFFKNLQIQVPNVFCKM